MSESTCLRLWPAKECGAFGICINNTCICQEGWTQSLEFNYFVRENELNKSLCNFNKALVQGLFTFYFALALLCVILQVYTTPHNKQGSRNFRRSWPHILGYIFDATYLVYRVIDQKAFFGIDPLMNFLFALTWTWGMIWASSAFTVHIKYLSKAYPMSEDNRWIARYFPRVSFVFNIVTSMGMQLFWISTLVHDNNDSLIILRISLLVLNLNLFYYGFANYMTGIVITDMKTLINLNDDGSSRTTSTNPSAQLVSKLKIELSRLRTIRRSMTLTWFSIVPTVGLLPLIVDWWLLNFAYVGVMYYAPYATYTMIIMIKKYQKRRAQYRASKMISSVQATVETRLVSSKH